MFKSLVVFVSLQLAIIVSGFPYFQTRIPNGNNVPHPCKPNIDFDGVGHINYKGGGPRNPFGKAFKNAGLNWKSVCNVDTDEDGRTNGQELGDPNCVFEEGDVPQRNTSITHPGVCDPWDSAYCKSRNVWIDCNPENDFKCDAFNEVGMKNITVRFPPTNVPNTETNYYCMVFDLPQDQEYYLTATTPHIANKYVMHHILLFGCNEGEIKMPLNTPQKCGMGDDKCNRLLSAWSVGFNGDCLHKNIGIPFGKTKGYKRAMLQFHYNNPELRSDYVDSSGMNLFYTTTKRDYNGAVLMIGQMYMEIPPDQEQVEVVGTCDSDCTRKQFTGKVNVTKAFNHMHYLGRQMKIEQFRNGIRIRTITDDPVYTYDNPVIYNFEDTFEIEPGDELKTTCTFTSLKKLRTTFYGEGTSDEMCYGFLTYYPEANIKIPYCYSWGSIPQCKTEFYPGDFPVIQGCHWHKLLNISSPYAQDVFSEISQRCRAFGNCLPECLEERKRLKDHPCLNGDIDKYFRNGVREGYDPNAMRFYAAFDSCNVEMSKIENPCECEKCPVINTSCRHVISAFTVVFAVTISIFK